MNQPPILVVGVDRSGTTLLSLMLDAHSRIAIPYESKFFIRYYKRRSRFGDLGLEEPRKDLMQAMLREPTVQQWDCVPAWDNIDLNGWETLPGAISALYSAYAGARGKTLWGDKTPSYITHLHILNRMFPDALFVHIIRDGRDVANSLMKQWWGPNDFPNALRYWHARVSCARKMLGMLPDERSLEIRFEDLVSDPAGAMEEVTNFIGVDFEAKMLNEYSREADKKVGNRIGSIHTHLREAPNADQAFKWKETLCPADQALAYEIAGDLFDQLDYPSGVTSHRLKPVRELYHRLHGSLAWRLPGRKRSD